MPTDIPWLQMLISLVAGVIVKEIWDNWKAKRKERLARSYGYPFIPLTHVSQSAIQWA